MLNRVPNRFLGYAIKMNRGLWAIHQYGDLTLKAAFNSEKIGGCSGKLFQSLH